MAKKIENGNALAIVQGKPDFSVIASRMGFNPEKARMRFALTDFRDNVNLVDNLVKYEMTAYGENAISTGAGIARCSIVRAIMNDATQMDGVKSAKFTDDKGKQKTYADTASPLSRFLQDYLSIGKTEAAATIALAKVIFDENGDIKSDPPFFAFTWGALKAMQSASDNNLTLDYIARHLDPQTPVSAVRDAVNNMRVALANDRAREAQAKAQASTRVDATNAESGADGTKAESGADGTNATNAESGTETPKASTRVDGKPFLMATPRNMGDCYKLVFAPKEGKDYTPDENAAKVFYAKSGAAFVKDFCKSVPLYIPISAALFAENGEIYNPDLFKGYKVEAAFLSMRKDALAAYPVFILSVETAKEETDKQRDKRISRALLEMSDWLTGNLSGDGIPKASDVPNALEIYNKAVGLIRSVPFMIAANAIKHAAKENAQ